MKIKTMLTTLISTTALIAGLSISAYAGNGSDSHDSHKDHNHTGQTTDHDAKKAMPMKGMMQERMKAMQAEMQTIIDTEDKAKRQALFTAHKAKMQGMMGMMQNMHGDCNSKMDMKDMKKAGSKDIDHQAETD